MKNIYILFLILLVSCDSKKIIISKSLRIDLSEKKYFLGTRVCCNDETMIFEFQAKNDSLKGKVTHIRFFKDSSTLIKGTIKNSIIEFTYKESGLKDSIAHGIIGINEIKIKLNNYNELTLQEIDSNTYYKKYFEVYPKLITLEKDTISGDYLFEIRIENWNSRTYYGESTITIKDKMTKKVIQKIKSDKFFFNKSLSMGIGYHEDYNFDNITDLRFYNGNNGGYGTHSFDYYIFDKEKELFIHNEQLDEIAAAMGIEIDTINKRILSYSKAGCCVHAIEAYLANKNKFILIKSLLVDEFNNNVVSKNKVKEKWSIIEKPFSDFTKEQIDNLYKNF